MPFINTKYSGSITPEQETEIKTELGKAIALLGKSENWLMLGFEPEATLYFGGEKSEKIAFVDVSLFGNPQRTNLFTAEVCRILKNALGVPADHVYVKYSPVKEWGWNGDNL